MLNLWTLGGLSPLDLLRRTARESWHDAVFGQGGRIAFYHFLAIFPSLLVFLALGARIPHVADPMKSSLQELSRLVLPSEAARLFEQIMHELSGHALSGLQLVYVCGGALWASLNATWAMIYGLNKAYEIEERRRGWKLILTIVGLASSVGATGLLAVFLMFCGANLENHFHTPALAIHMMEWIALSALLSVSFAVFYRFAPNLRDHEWRWSTPGALCALILWVGATLAAHFYFVHVNNYVRSYGHLNSVVMLLLWLYVVNGAILIGGEMNSEIEKAAAAETPDEADSDAPTRDRSGS